MKICIVGCGDSLSGKGFGPIIDDHDIVVRLDSATIPGYEADVGTRISHLWLHPGMIKDGTTDWNNRWKHTLHPENDHYKLVAESVRHHAAKRSVGGDWDAVHKRSKGEDNDWVETSKVNQDHINRLNRDAEKYSHTGSKLIMTDKHFRRYKFWNPETKKLETNFRPNFDLQSLWRVLISKNIHPDVQVYTREVSTHEHGGDNPKWASRGINMLPMSGSYLIDWYLETFDDSQIFICGFGHPFQYDRVFKHYADEDIRFGPERKMSRDLENGIKKMLHDPRSEILWLEKLHHEGRLTILEMAKAVHKNPRFGRKK